MIIYLGCRSPGASSNLPGDLGRAALKRLPIWSCSWWGLPCPPCHHGGGELLPRLFTLTLLLRGGIFSAALSLGLPPVRVTNHHALRSSDFPLRLFTGAIMRPLQIHYNTPAPFTALNFYQWPRWPVDRPGCFSRVVYGAPGRFEIGQAIPWLVQRGVSAWRS